MGYTAVGKNRYGFKDRSEESHITKQGYKVTIIEYFGKDSCTIQFEDGTILKNRTYVDIVKGSVKHPLHPTICGLGYIGIGKHIANIEGKATKVFTLWNGMFQRCYNVKNHEKQPSYIGCSVDERWHNFQVFGDWFEENYVDGQALDKDILFKGNKVYSPETCRFVPALINSLLVNNRLVRGDFPIGVSRHNKKFRAYIIIDKKQVHLGIFNTPEEAFNAYKTAKEICIRDTANLCKDEITIETYNALINWVIEITD